MLGEMSKTLWFQIQDIWCVRQLWKMPLTTERYLTLTVGLGPHKRKEPAAWSGSGRSHCTNPAPAFVPQYFFLFPQPHTAPHWAPGPHCWHLWAQTAVPQSQNGWMKCGFGEGNWAVLPFPQHFFPGSVDPHAWSLGWSNHQTVSPPEEGGWTTGRAFSCGSLQDFLCERERGVCTLSWHH